MGSYGINIPVQVYDRGDLRRVYDELRGVSTGTRQLTQDQAAFLKTVRETTIESGSLTKALKEIYGGTTAASQGFKQMAGELITVIAETKEAEVQANRMSSAFGRFSGMIIGREALGAIGLPAMAGGRLGGSLLGPMLGGGAGMAVGGALATGFAAYEVAHHVEQLAKWAVEQRDLALEIGVTTAQMQQFTRVSELSGVNIQSAAKAVANLSEQMMKGGARAKEITGALSELGLGRGTAFQSPAEAINLIVGALAKIPDEGQRASVAVDLLGESGRKLAAVATDWKDLIGRGKIIDDQTMQQLRDAKMAVSELGEEWDLLIAKFAKPLKWVAEGAVGAGTGVQNLFAGLGAVGSATVGSLTKPGYSLSNSLLDYGFGGLSAGGGAMWGIGGVSAPAPVADKPLGFFPGEKELRADWARDVQGRYGNPQEKHRLALEDVDLEEKKLLKGFEETGTIGYRDFAQGMASQEGRRKQADEALRAATELRSQREEFSRLKPISDITPEEAASQAAELPRRFFRMTNTPEYRLRMRQLLALESGLLSSRTSDLMIRDVDRIISELDREEKRTEQDSRKFAEEHQKAAAETVRTGLTGARGQNAVSQAGYHQSVALAAAAQERRTSSGRIGPLSLAQSDFDSSMALIRQNFGNQQGYLGAEAATYRLGAAKALPGSDQQAELLAQAQEKDLEILGKETEARVQSIDATTKFNEAITKVSQQMREDFAQGFTSIVMGAQHGRSGFVGALRGFAEGQEQHILSNLGKELYDKINLPHAKQGTGLGDILSGTIFGPKGVPKNPELEANTVALRDLTAALRGARNGGGAGAGDIYNLPQNDAGGNPNLLNWGSLTGDITQTAGALGPLAGIAGAGNSVAAVAAVGSSLSKLGAALAQGATKAGNFGAIFSGNLSTTQEIGAIAGTVGLGIGAYEGIATMTHGGAKNISGGLGGALGAIAPMTGPAAPYVAAAAAIAGLVSSFLPDPRVTRSNEISKTMFTSQYLAPPAMNLSESGNGGYADVDMFGNVRTSHLSPYPIVSDPYLDVPRRTDVPGHTISTFGGYQNQTGARTAPPNQIHYHTWNISTMDAKSFADNAGQITDAVHLGLSRGFHPLVHTVAQQLGLR